MAKVFRTIISLLLLFTLLAPHIIQAFGTITHVGSAEDIISMAKNGELPQDIASAILQYPANIGTLPILFFITTIPSSLLGCEN
jgi:hypothetical protein